MEMAATALATVAVVGFEDNSEEFEVAVEVVVVEAVEAVEAAEAAAMVEEEMAAVVWAVVASAVAVKVRVELGKAAVALGVVV
jgi:hypothetical protein